MVTAMITPTDTAAITPPIVPPTAATLLELPGKEVVVAPESTVVEFGLEDTLVGVIVIGDWVLQCRLCH